MGLDLYLYKLTKPRLKKSKTYTEDELSNYNTSLVEDNDLDEDFIEKFTQTINVDSSYWDYEKLYQKFKEKYPDVYQDEHKPEHLEFIQTGQSYENGWLSYTWQDSYLKTSITTSGRKPEDFKDVLVTKIKPTYVWKSEMINHQKNGITDYGFEILPENCEYCMDYYKVKELVSEGLDHSFLDDWIDGQTSLLAWS